MVVPAISRSATVSAPPQAIAVAIQRSASRLRAAAKTVASSTALSA